MSDAESNRAHSIIVTTPWADTTENRVRAKSLAALFAGDFVVRANRSVEALFADTEADYVLVSGQTPTLYHRGSPAQGLFFHPSLAVQRVVHLREGRRDRLIGVADIRPGDTVLDATLGLGSDALVLAEAVGAHGRVIACEGAPVLANLFKYAKLTADQQDERVRPLFSRITVMHTAHLRYMHSLSDGAVDVVYFDPMFRLPPDRVSSIEPLRGFANSEPLSEAAFAEAKRVAKRTVVVKERPNSEEFSRLHLQPDRPRARIAFGVWHAPDGEKGGAETNGR